MHNSRAADARRARARGAHPPRGRRGTRAIEDGDRCRISSAHGAIELPARVSDEVKRGTIAVPHGWGHRGGWRLANAAGGANVNLLASSDPEDLERLAGMAFLNGIPVRLEPVDRGAGGERRAGRQPRTLRSLARRPRRRSPRRRGRSRRASSRGRRPARSPASSGAPTPTRIGQPATAAFCTSSNESRPLTQRIDRQSGSRPVEQRPADHLVHRVVAADVLAAADELAGGVEEPGGVQAAGALEPRLGEALGQRRRAARGRPAGPRRARRRVHGDLLERALAADAAGGGRVEAPLARVAQQRAGDLDHVARPGPSAGRPRAARRSAPRRGGSRARAPRRGPACASSPRAASPSTRISSGSSTATWSRAPSCATLASASRAGSAPSR